MPKSSSSGGVGGWLKFFAILLGVLTPLFYVLEQNLESFYVFEVDHLRDLAKRGVEAHPNDTRAIVQYIVDELSQKTTTKNHINLDEEWIFNNAGGAMGAMYIIHASMSPSLYPLSLFLGWTISLPLRYCARGAWNLSQLTNTRRRH